MDKLIPILILLGIAVIGFISKFLELGDTRSRYEFTAEYRNKFISYVNELFSKHSFNQQLYYDLTSKVKEMQCKLGADGIYAYVQDNLKGYCTSDYQLLVNFLPETRNVLNDFNNTIMMTRYNQSIQDCDDMFIRHMGNLELVEKSLRKELLNPFSDFAEGVKFIILSPFLLLKWFGFLSNGKSQKIKKNIILKIINFVVTTVGFISGVMAIIMGLSDFWQMIRTLFHF